jgi:hypothetical protein
VDETCGSGRAMLDYGVLQVLQCSMQYPLQWPLQHHTSAAQSKQWASQHARPPGAAPRTTRCG